MSGCPIPDSGDPVSVPICLPDGWQSLISELLMFPTALEFWDNLATLEDRTAASKTAHAIVHDFQSEDCTCEPECPSGNYYAFDFESSDGGWYVPDGGYGEYVSSVGWRTEVVALGDGDHAKLNIIIDDFSAYITLIEVLNAVLSLGGGGTKVPVKVNLAAYSAALGTAIKSNTDLEMTAIGTNVGHYLKPSLNVRNVCHSLTTVMLFDVDIGPYNAMVTTAEFVLADLRYWLRLP